MQHALPFWALVAAVMLPVGFLVGAVGIAVARGVRRRDPPEA